MKKILLCSLMLGSLFTMNGQEVLFEDSFEDYTTFAIADLGEWTLTDVDGLPSYGFQGVAFDNSGDPFAFIVFDSGATTPPLEPSEGIDWSARTGNNAMVSFAAVPDGGQGNDDWLISPQIQLLASGNTVTFWAKTCDGTYDEEFTVGISTTGTATTDFTIISEGASVTAPNEWTEYTFDLDDYAGEMVYIAINCISNDQFGFAVDDFSVTADTMGLNDVLSSSLSVYPNPANNVINISGANNILLEGAQIVDINGRTVKTVNFGGVSEAQINISDLSAGMYMMNLSSDQGMVTKKIVKK